MTADDVPWDNSNKADAPTDAVARIEREWTAMPGDPRLNDICWFDRLD